MVLISIGNRPSVGFFQYLWSLYASDPVYDSVSDRVVCNYIIFKNFQASETNDLAGSNKIIQYRISRILGHGCLPHSGIFSLSYYWTFSGYVSSHYSYYCGIDRLVTVSLEVYFCALILLKNNLGPILDEKFLDWSIILSVVVVILRHVFSNLFEERPFLFTFRLLVFPQLLFDNILKTFCKRICSGHWSVIVIAVFKAWSVESRSF